MSKIFVDEIAGIASANTVAIPGHVIQVVQAWKSDSFTTTSASYVDIPDLSLTITPSSTSSTILLAWSFIIGSDDTRPDILFRLVRGSTNIALSNATTEASTGHIGNEGSGSFKHYQTHQAAGSYLDSPSSASALTYKMTIGNYTSGSNISVGRRWTNTSFITPSHLTAMEIAG
jgi:hypothetical protein